MQMRGLTAEIDSLHQHTECVYVGNPYIHHFSQPPNGCKCFPLFLTGNYSNKLLIVTLLLLAGDVEVNPGPGGSSFPCGLCEIDTNWSNGGIACEHCDV